MFFGSRSGDRSLWIRGRGMASRLERRATALAELACKRGCGENRRMIAGRLTVHPVSMVHPAPRRASR